ncbi:hypothetical protein M0805_001689 [Coniferiporia weirii]|nr:hypothetical protein M0805_001689 [Coniferiporia weirii]
MDRDLSLHASAASFPTTLPSSTPGLFSSARHPSSAKPVMGQAESAARASPILAPVVLPPAQPTSRYRFAWPGRRKKSEDFGKMTGRVSPAPAPTPSPAPRPAPSAGSVGKGKGRELDKHDAHISQADNDLHLHELVRPPSRSSAKQLTFQFASNTLHALKGKLNASQSSIHSLRSPATPPPPPPLPPKPDDLDSSDGNLDLSSKSNPQVQQSDASAPIPEVESQPEVIPVVAGDDIKIPQRRERREDTQSARDIAEDWRKSDSTLRTVRLVGGGTPRPLSLAESTNSSQTVLPSVGPSSANIGAGKRLSALMADVDFGMPEVDSEDESMCDSVPPSAFSSVHDVREMHRQHASVASSSRSSSPTSLNQAGSRRGSFSLRIGRLSASKGRAVPSGHLSGSDSEAHSSVSTHGMRTANSSATSVTSSPSAKDSTSLDARPSLEIASASSVGSDMSDIHKYRHPTLQGKEELGSWHHTDKALGSRTSLSTSESSQSLSKEHPPSQLSMSHGPSIRPAHQRTRLQSIQSKGFRQTAVSLTTGLVPAAGFAKKAVDKLGRALGGSSTSLDASSMSTSHTPSASSSSFFAMMGRSATPGHHQYPQSHSNSHHIVRQQQAHGQQALGRGPPRISKKVPNKHAPNASGSWSIGSNSNSLSDTDGPTSQGFNLGRCMRGPLHPGARGLLFGRDLSQSVRDTSIDGEVSSDGDMLKLEGRPLPALVTRCAQHIIKWGVQEEGLFRISGRSTHVARLRAEFDSGADYDMRECGPGEIDPHAVSSVFKAYLRELPEPLLTRNLMPYFEAALSAEHTMTIAAEAQNGRNNSGVEKARVPGLPSSPKSGMQVHKAPSLSTFAIPTLLPRVASESLLSTLASLIARLPRENRDLLLTVTELIMATAHCAAETKMPLSNLLLVFCPSLAMSPPLLRVLCEGEGIWDGSPRMMRSALITEDIVLDIRSPSPVITKAEGVSSNEGNRKGDVGPSSRPSMRQASETNESPEDATTSKDFAEAVTNTPLVVSANTALTVDSPSTPSDSPASAGSKAESILNISNSPYPPFAATSSSESLNTSPSSDSDSPANGTSLRSAASGKPAVACTQTDLSAPVTRRNNSSAVDTVPFPIDDDSGPDTSLGQVRPSSTHLRLSMYSSSSPNLRTLNPGPSSPASLKGRKSKASLQSLFPKRSLSSLLGLSQQQQAMAGSAEMTLEELEPTPLHKKRAAMACPVLNLPVDTSPLRLGLNLDSTVSSDKACTAGTVTTAGLGPTPRPQAAVMNRASSDSSGLSSSVFYTPPTTTRSLAPVISLASSASSGSYSFLDFNINKNGEEEDWATSVLQAATSDA